MKFEWCHDCKEYDQNAHCCHRWTKVIRNTVDDLKTQGYEPVRHGYWIMLHKTHNVDEDNDYDWRCSECNHVDCHNINVEVPYCWHCGAKMDLNEVNDEIN